MTKGWKNIYFLAKKKLEKHLFLPKSLENSFLVSVVTLYLKKPKPKGSPKWS